MRLDQDGRTSRAGCATRRGGGYRDEGRGRGLAQPCPVPRVALDSHPRRESAEAAPASQVTFTFPLRLDQSVGLASKINRLPVCRVKGNALERNEVNVIGNDVEHRTRLQAAINDNPRNPHNKRPIGALLDSKLAHPAPFGAVR